MSLLAILYITLQLLNCSGLGLVVYGFGLGLECYGLGLAVCGLGLGLVLYGLGLGLCGLVNIPGTKSSNKHKTERMLVRVSSIIDDTVHYFNLTSKGQSWSQVRLMLRREIAIASEFKWSYELQTWYNNYESRE